jgi:hypothetical protein
MAPPHAHGLMAKASSTVLTFELAVSMTMLTLDLLMLVTWLTFKAISILVT